jgi:hypothetical protein
MRTAILIAMAAAVLVARTAVATTVTNLNDGGDGSLRAAVAATCRAASSTSRRDSPAIHSRAPST